MKAVEILSLAEKIVKMLSDAGIKTDDWRYLDLWREYDKAVRNGAKASAVVMVMAEKYGVSESAVWRVLRRFKTEVGQ